MFNHFRIFCDLFHSTNIFALARQHVAHKHGSVTQQCGNFVRICHNLASDLIRTRTYTHTQARRSDVVVQGSTCDGVVWFRGNLPGGLFENENSWGPSVGGRMEEMGFIDPNAERFRSEVLFEDIATAAGLTGNSRKSGFSATRNSTRPPDDLLEVPGKGDAVFAMQWIIDRNGCDKVRSVHRGCDELPCL